MTKRVPATEVAHAGIKVLKEKIRMQFRAFVLCCVI